MSEEPNSVEEETIVEMVEKPVTRGDEEEEVEVTFYKISDPRLVEILLKITDLLEKLSRKEITVSEARAIYETDVTDLLREVAESMPKPQKKPVKKKSQSKKRKTKK